VPPPAPAPGGEPAPDQLAQADGPALVPPAVLPPPHADHAPRPLSAGSLPPDDLVVTLSRLTC
jgi:hypothetical protein